MDLARRAALVVSEDFPAPPLPRWTGALAARTSAPVWIVDTACVVPMKLVPADSGGGPHDRAFRFRDAIRPLLDERLERPWPEVAEAPAPFDPAELGFAPTDLREADLRGARDYVIDVREARVSGLRVDHVGALGLLAPFGIDVE